MKSQKRRSIVIIAIASLVVLLIMAAVGLWIGLSRSFRRNVYRTAEKIERESKGALKIGLGDVDVSPFGRRVVLHDVSLEFNKKTREPLIVNIGAIDVKKWTQIRSGGDFTREQEIEFHRISSPQLDAHVALAPPAVKKRLAAPITFDGEYRASYQPEEQKEFRLDVSVSSAQLGALSLDLDVSGLDLAKLEQMGRDAKIRQTGAVHRQLQQGALTLLAELRIHGARIVLRNSGLMEVVYCLEAADKGATPDEARRRMLDRLRGECDKRAEPWMRSLCEPLIIFIEKPKSIRLALDPPSPVDVAGLPAQLMTGGPQSVIDRLGLRLAANEE
ncbi:MAG: hypothetical protein JXO72_04610 [Vicinamibacteria bacterium]|nr:hypothetical protein [Vicinamibacteria bacterium]